MRVLGRVEKFRDRLQLEVKSIEAAPGVEPAALTPASRRDLNDTDGFLESLDTDPAELTPALRRDADELDGFLDFLAGEITHPGLAAVVKGILADPDVRGSFRALPAAGADGHHGYAGGLLEHTVGVATLCRETAQLHPRLRHDLLLAAALLHDVGRTVELGRGPSFRPTEEGRLLGHVHLGLRLIERASVALDEAVRAELLHAVATHHDRQDGRTAEASVLYHANQLDAQAATRSVGDEQAGRQS